MAAIINNAFLSLEVQLRLCISQLLEAYPTQEKLIYNKSRSLSNQIDIIVTDIEKHRSLSIPISLNREKRLVQNATITSTEPMSNPKDVNNRIEDTVSEHSFICETIDWALLAAAQDSGSLQSPHNALRMPPQSASSLVVNTLPFNKELANSKSVAEHSSDPPPSTPNSCSGVQVTLAQVELVHPEFDIRYEFEDDILRLHRTIEQWEDFPLLLACARDLHVEDVGVCKIVLPEGSVGLLHAPSNSMYHCYTYRARPQQNSTWSIKRSEYQSSIHINKASVSNLAQSLAVDWFERSLNNASQLSKVQYFTDIDLRSKDSRQKFGLPASPIWPLKGDCLPKTRGKVPGLHWPYGYKGFDAFFAMHREDYDTFSINYLYQGEKFWIVIPQAYTSLLEDKCFETNASYYKRGCSQFLRESATYFSKSTLEDWNVPTKVLRQNAGEVIVTFPRVYHQGFSKGHTLAEAVNYAEDKWDTSGYCACTEICPEGYIPRSLMEVLDGTIQTGSIEDTSADIDNETTSREEQNKRPRFNMVKKHQSDQVAAKLKQPPKPQGNDLADNRIKRKGHTTEADEIPKKLKISLSEERPKQTITTLFTGLAPIPQKIVQPLQVLQIFAERCGERDQKHISVLTKLFFAVGSPDAFNQLRDAFKVIRGNDSLPISQSIESISETMHALDKLDTTISTALIFRRYYSARLMYHRQEKEVIHLRARSTYKTRATDHNVSTLLGNDSRDSLNAEVEDIYGRASSKALLEMMKEAYPDLKPMRKRASTEASKYQKKLQSLKDRLRLGRNWFLLQKRLPMGILALVPTRGEYQIQNIEVEKLPLSAFSIFLDVLIEYRGDFLQKVSGMISQHVLEILRREDLSRKYLFEEVDEGRLKKEPLDSAKFIEFCELE